MPFVRITKQRVYSTKVELNSYKKLYNHEDTLKNQ
jgi:hypothetical protein